MNEVSRTPGKLPRPGEACWEDKEVMALMTFSYLAPRPRLPLFFAVARRRFRRLPHLLASTLEEMGI
jgi:hypothetical protein